MPLCSVKVGNRHAGAVQRDAVSQAHIVQVANGGLDREAFAMGCSFAQSLDGRDVAYASNDACEHVRYFGRNAQAHRIGRYKSLELPSALNPRKHAQLGADQGAGLKVEFYSLRECREGP